MVALLVLLAVLAVPALAAATAAAATAAAAAAAAAVPHPAALLLPRTALLDLGLSGIITVTDSATGLAIPQSSATDGGGHGHDPLAVLWLVFALLAGLPLALAGLRLGRLTTGLSFGLALIALVWTALTNTVSAPGVSDTLTTALALAVFALGFLAGLLRTVRPAGLAALALAGGAALGARLALLRPGLLIASPYADWAIIGGGALACAVLVALRQRAGVALAAASAGAFLVALGLDLAVNGQAGISSGLRLLLDRNSAHVADLYVHPYAPNSTTYTLLGLSLGLVPVLAYAQHRAFPGPFYVRPGGAVPLPQDDEEHGGGEKADDDADADSRVPLRRSSESVRGVRTILRKARMGKPVVSVAVMP